MEGHGPGMPEAVEGDVRVAGGPDRTPRKTVREAGRGRQQWALLLLLTRVRL